MKPYQHARGSVSRWGGKPEDYQAIHDFIDSSKAHVPDMRHRIFLHSSFGIYITERVFGTNITNSDGRLVSVRDIAEHHVIEDMGTIPTPQDYLDGLNPLDPQKRSAGMPLYPWLGGRTRRPTRTHEQTAPAVD